MAVGICATTELANTLNLTDHMLALQSTGMALTEIIVATPNYQLAKKLEEKGPRVTVLLEKRREGKAKALNKIVERVSADILVLASADIRIQENTLSSLVTGLATNEDWGAVDSRVELVNDDEILMDRISNCLWEIHNAMLDDLDEGNRLGHVAGDLLAIKRSLLERIPMIINDDAYVATRVREKGFLVKRIQEALVWIAGPRTPTDYVLQRSRILGGHLQLILRFGRIPTTFEFQLFSKPRQAIRILVRVVAKRGPTGFLPLCVAGILELISFQVALLSLMTGLANRPWPIVKSTKKIEPPTSKEISKH